MKRLLPISLFSTILGVPAMAQEIPASAQVHIYQSGFAVVQEERTLDVKEGLNALTLQDLPSKLIPDSVLVTAKGLDILTQSFEAASFEEIYLRKYFLGKEVKLVSRLEDNPKTQTGTIISAIPFAIRMEGHLLTEQALRNFDIMYPTPENLLDFEPALSLQAQSKSSGSLPVDLKYQTGSFSWQAGYVGLLNSDQSQLSLKSMATIANQEFRDFDNMKVTLIAGDIRPPQRPIGIRREAMAMSYDSEAPMMSKQNVTNEALGHVQLFELEPLVSLDSNQSVSYPFLPTIDLALNEELIVNFITYEASQRAYNQSYEYEDTRPQRVLVFNNETGYALPSGTIKIYEKHNEDTSYFTGEMQLQNTARNEEVRLSMGQTYNIKATRKMLNFKDYIFSDSQNLSYEVTLSNARDHEVTILVNENTPPKAKISNASHPYEKIEATMHQFTVTIPAGEKVIVTYDVEL